MDPYIILTLTHFVSDWMFQPATWGGQKIKHFKPRLYHAIQYTVLFIPVLYLMNINMWWLAWVFGTHLFLDSYRFVGWWNKHIRQATPQNHPKWIEVVQDQILHLLVLVPLVVL